MTGDPLPIPSKRLYSQSFALYGLAEYARARRDALVGRDAVARRDDGAGRGPKGGRMRLTARA